MRPDTPASPTKAARRSKRTQAFKHALWKTSLVLRGQRYRVAQIRRIVLVALEHLHIPGDARVMEVSCKTNGTGLVVAIAWGQSLPALETAALSRYIITKIQTITGLSYAQQDVFFEPYPPPKTEITEKHVSSWWLRERIHRLTAPGNSSRHKFAQSRTGETDHQPTLPPAADLHRSHVRSTSKGHMTHGDAAAMVAALRQRLHQSRMTPLKAAQQGMNTQHNGKSPGHEDAIIDGFLTVHADLQVHHEALAEVSR